YPVHNLILDKNKIKSGGMENCFIIITLIPMPDFTRVLTTMVCHIRTIKITRKVRRAMICRKINNRKKKDTHMHIPEQHLVRINIHIYIRVLRALQFIIRKGMCIKYALIRHLTMDI